MTENQHLRILVAQFKKYILEGRVKTTHSLSSDYRSSVNSGHIQLISDLNVDIVDTRKTIPGWRILDKYSVLAGGGANHRIDLGQMIMLKDNHLNSGNLDEIVKKSKHEYPELKIEVEVENEFQLNEVLFLPIERIMLDNWEIKKASEAVKKIRSKNKDIIIEISGGINKESIRSYALCLPDIISLGSVTHSAKALDISLEVA